ncbi:phage tape measure protein [Fibrella aestuarina BUZ 2]|uniref:Phage tape measure protein n=2 Tax=Fibrella TaxID=861914 RepID=I0K2M4_9BACT|nr:phage tape measure protein [Fibrella aestuarina BUZ 2]
MLGFTNTVQRESSQIDQLFSRLGQAAAGAFAVAGLAGLPQQLVKVRGEFQQLEIAFTTMLRSKEKSDTLIRELSNEALKSPFQLSELSQGAKQLLAYGSSAEGVVSELRMIGDVASGVSAPVGDLIYLYGTLRSQGRAYAVDLRQFAGRGIPIYAELSKVLGVSVEQVNDLVSAGKVGFPQVEQAFKNMTSTGGMFEGLMAKQVQSLTGLASNFKDAWAQMLNEIGKETEGPIGAAIQGATELTTHYKDIAKYLAALAAGYGAYKAAVVITTTVERTRLFLLESLKLEQALAAASGEVLTEQQGRQIVVSKFLARAQAQLNATMLANPYVAVATVLATLVAAYFAFREEVIEVKTAQQLLGEATADINKRVGEQAGEVKSLTGILKNQNIAESERLKAYNRLREISPDIVRGLDFQRAKTADLTNEVNNYISALRQQISLEVYSAKYKEAFTKQIEAQDNVDKKRQEFLDKQKASQASKSTGPINASGSAMGYDAGAASSAGQLLLARQAFESAVEAKQQADRAIGELDKVMGSVYQQGTKQGLEAQKKKLEIQLSQLGQLNKLSKAYKYTEDQLAAVNKQLDTLNSNPKADQSFADRLAKANDAGTLRLVASYAKTDKLRDDLIKKVKEKRTDAVDGSKEKAALEKLESDLEKLTAKGRAKAGKAAAKEAEKEGIFGSEQYYANIIQKADELIRKTTDPKIQQQQQAIKDNAQRQIELIKRSVEAPLNSIPFFEAQIADAQKALEKLPVGADPALIKSYQSVVTESQKQLDELRKRNAVKTFGEELEEKQRQYVLYESWVAAYGQEAADKQFANLKVSGTSYLDYLDKQIAALESKRGGGVLSEQDAQNLTELIGQKKGLTGGKSAIEAFTDQLQRAKAEAGSLTQYLKYLEAQQAKLDPKDTSALTTDKRVVIQKEKVETTSQRFGNLQEFLKSVVDSEEQRQAIENHYADLRAQADEFYIYKESKAYKDFIANLEKARKEELKGVKDATVEGSDEFKAFTKTITSEGRKALKERLKQADDELNYKKKLYGEDSEEYRKAVLSKRQAERDLATDRLQYYQEFAQFFGELGGMLSGLTGELGEMGRLLSGVSAGAGKLVSSFKPGITGQERLNIGLSAGLDLINIITSSSAQRQQAESDFMRNQIALQQQYNLALNEQIGIQSSTDSNVFIKDKEKALRGGIEQLGKANTDYLKSIALLSQGRAKNGQSDKTDWGAVGSGAVAGATIGSVIPGVGTVIGAVGGAIVGGLIGLFGGEKRTDDYIGLLEKYPGLIKQGANGQAEINKELAQSLLASNQLDEATQQLVQNTLDWQGQIEKAKEQINGAVADLAGGLGDSLRDALVSAFSDGTDAAERFGESVSDTLENVLSQIIFNSVFKSQFDELQKQLVASFDVGGDNNVIDDLGNFYQKYNYLVTDFSKALSDAQLEADKFGLDIFSSKDKKSQKAGVDKGLSGAIKGVTEETASVLAGQLNAIRITQADNAVTMRSQLVMLTNISNNSNYLSYLRTIDRTLEEMKANAKADPLRAKGG